MAMTKTSKFLIATGFSVATVLGLGTSALAGGPPKDVLDRNDNTWACEAEAELPPESKGVTMCMELCV